MELMTAIAVICLLAAMLMPAFSNARERARRVSCLNNIRQIGLAMNVYAQENRTSLPPYFYQVQSIGGGQFALNIKPQLSLADVGSGASLGILTCPSDKSPAQVQTTDPNGQNITVASSYAYNFTLFMQGLSQLAVGSYPTTVLVCDGRPGSATNSTWWGSAADCTPGPNGKIMICHNPGPGENTIEVGDPSVANAHLKHGDYCGPCGGGAGINYQQFNQDSNLNVDRRHSKKMNVIFLDCHAEWLSDLPANGLGP